MAALDNPKCADQLCCATTPPLALVLYLVTLNAKRLQIPVLAVRLIAVLVVNEDSGDGAPLRQVPLAEGMP